MWRYLVARGFVIPTLCVACLHADSSLEPVIDNEAVARLQRQNTGLRRRIQILEDRALRLEHVLDPAASVSSGREVPVVQRVPTRAPAAIQRERGEVVTALAQRRSFTLEPIPQSTVSAAAVDDEADGGWERELQEGEAAETPTRYRLVGSRLVNLTQARGSKRPDRRARRGGRVVSEYEQAMKLYKAGELRSAEAAFARFAATHAEHDYADNALYWRGEAAYDQSHFSVALATFTDVVEKYGGGNKAPDALLKIGLCYAKLGDTDNARDVLDRLVAAYPSAEASAIAQQRLEALGD